MKNRMRLNVVALENRLTPAISTSFAGGNLTIIGDNTANNVAIVAVGNNSLQVTAGAGKFGPFAVTGNLNVSMGNSNDTVSVNLAGFTLAGNITASLGNGADTFDFVMTGGSLTGNITVNGGNGNDTCNINAGANAGVGTIGGRTTVNGNLDTDNVNLGNSNGVSSFQNLVYVTGAQNVQWSTSQNDFYANDVMFSHGGETTGLTLQEGQIGGSNVVTVAGAVRILGGGGDDVSFLRGMNIGGELLAAVGAGANQLALSSSAASTTVVNGNLTYVGGACAENVDVSSGIVNGNVTLTTFDGNDSINLNTFSGPTIIGGNLTITTGNGNVTYTGGGIGALVNGNVSINTGNGNSTIPFAANGFIVGRITVTGGGGSTYLQFLGAQTYNVFANLGAGDDTVELNNAAAGLTGVIDGGAGNDQFLQTAGSIVGPLDIRNF